MKCLIIAAGMGTRLAARGDSKPLVEVIGKPLIERVVSTFIKTGISDFYVVIGYNGDKVRRKLTDIARQLEISVTFIDNDRWKEPNGISVYCAREMLREPFFLSMSDHLFDPAIPAEMNREGVTDGEVILAVDRRIENNPLIDLDDVTKVQTKDGLIRDIGKHLETYDAFDTGIFLCTPALFESLGKSIAEGDASLSGGIRKLAAKKKARVFDIGSRNWLDVDDDAAFEKAERLFV